MFKLYKSSLKHFGKKQNGYIDEEELSLLVKSHFPDLEDADWKVKILYHENCSEKNNDIKGFLSEKEFFQAFKKIMLSIVSETFWLKENGYTYFEY